MLGRMLHSAVHRGDLRRTKSLLEAGAQPNDWGHDGFTPLTRNHARDDASCAKIAQALIAAGARVDLPNASGMRALDYAALFCLPGLASLLLEAGSDADALNAKGLTPLGLLLDFCHNSPTSFDKNSVAAIESIFERQALLHCARSTPTNADEPKRRRL